MLHADSCSLVVHTVLFTSTNTRQTGMPLNSLPYYEHRSLCQSHLNCGSSLSIAELMGVELRQARCQQCRGQRHARENAAAPAVATCCCTADDRPRTMTLRPAASQLLRWLSRMHRRRPPITQPQHAACSASSKMPTASPLLAPRASQEGV